MRLPANVVRPEILHPSSRRSPVRRLEILRPCVYRNPPRASRRSTPKRSSCTGLPAIAWPPPGDRRPPGAPILHPGDRPSVVRRYLFLHLVNRTSAVHTTISARSDFFPLPDRSPSVDPFRPSPNISSCPPLTSCMADCSLSLRFPRGRALFRGSLRFPAGRQAPPSLLPPRIMM